MNILIRDHRLTLFLVKETQLEAKIADLEDELEEASERYEQDKAEYMVLHEESATSLNDHLSTEASKRKEALLRLKSLEEELKKSKVSGLLYY